MHPPRQLSYFDRSISVDISNKCILQCPACDRQTDKDMVKRARDISLQDYKKIIDVFSKVSLGGQISDPIYHPKFLELLKMSKDLIYLVVLTNGSGKKIEWWEKAFKISIENNNISWRFALDGLPNESHIYRINQDGNFVWEIMKMGRKMGANITWQYIPFLYNENHIDEAAQMAKEYDIEFMLKISNRHPTGMVPSKKRLRIDTIKIQD
jgi:MoaA/NifB/PqqE/SkfB family radical SAM enzyme